MDAVTIAAAALAIVVDESQQAAMQALLLERERLAMLAAHHESYMAQRHYVGTLQIPQYRPMTWETAFTQRHNDLVEAHQIMSAAVRDLRNGDDEAALSRLTAAVGDDNSEQSEDEEMSDAAMEEEEAADAEVSPILAQSD